MKFPPKFCRRPAFTLVELVVVMSGIAILLALVVPAITGFGTSTAMVTAGNKIANLAAFARQTAVSKNTMTALVMIADQGTADDFRTFAAVEYSAGAGWIQSTPWEKLPDGVIIDRSDPVNCSFLLNSPQPFPFLAGPPPLDDPPFQYLGQPVKKDVGYAARIFMPNGSLFPDAPAQIRLVEGFADGTRIIYKRPVRDQKGDATASNYYDLAIVPATGSIKVYRP